MLYNIIYLYWAHACQSQTIRVIMSLRRHRAPVISVWIPSCNTSNKLPTYLYSPVIHTVGTIFCSLKNTSPIQRSSIRDNFFADISEAVTSMYN